MNGICGVSSFFRGVVVCVGAVAVAATVCAVFRSRSGGEQGALLGGGEPLLLLRTQPGTPENGSQPPSPRQPEAVTALVSPMAPGDRTEPVSPIGQEAETPLLPPMGFVATAEPVVSPLSGERSLFSRIAQLFNPFLCCCKSSE